MRPPAGVCFSFKSWWSFNLQEIYRLLPLSAAEGARSGAFFDFTVCEPVALPVISIIFAAMANSVSE